VKEHNVSQREMGKQKSGVYLLIRSKLELCVKIKYHVVGKQVAILELLFCTALNLWVANHKAKRKQCCGQCNNCGADNPFNDFSKTRVQSAHHIFAGLFGPIYSMGSIYEKKKVK